MAKRINDLEIGAEYTEYAVEYDLNGETFVTEATSDGHEARLMRAVLDGKLVVRTVFETSWADA